MFKQSFLPDKEKQIDYFSKKQPHLDSVISNYTLKLTQKVIDKLTLKEGDSIIDIGCGSGRFTLPLLNRGLHVTGVDFSKELLDELRALKKNNLKIIQADIDHLEDLVKDKFNFATGFFILHHLNNLETSLKSLRKILKKGAKIAFVEPNPANPLYYIQPFISKNMSWNEEKGFRNMTAVKLKKAFENSGYSNFEIEKFGFFPPFLVNNKIGFRVDSFLERQSFLKPVLPFLLITAEINS